MEKRDQNIQWFPGHMTRAKRKIQSSLKLVDIVAEVIDARIPLSSRNPDLDNILGNKSRLILLNKCDMADPKETKRWIEHFASMSIKAIAIDCKSGRGVDKFFTSINDVLSEKIQVWKRKGMSGRNVRVMIVGIPNVGKSSLINRLVPKMKSKAKAEDRPGVTRGNQWFTLGNGFEVLDTPGVLWPKFDDATTGMHLAFTGAIKDQVVDTQDLASNLLILLKNKYLSDLIARYKFNKEEIENLSGYDLLKKIAQKRGMLISGGELDLERASIMILDEFRAAKIGKITLERLDEFDGQADF